MKWVNDSNVQFSRGNYKPCIFKFDNSKFWFNACFGCTTQTAKAVAGSMGKHYGAKEVTIKYLWNGESTTEPRENVIDFLYISSDEYKFRVELPVKEGERRNFKYFDEAEMFYSSETKGASGMERTEWIDNIIAAARDKADKYFDNWEEEQYVMQWLYNQRQGVVLESLDESVRATLIYIIAEVCSEEELFGTMKWFIENADSGKDNTNKE